MKLNLLVFLLVAITLIACKDSKSIVASENNQLTINVSPNPSFVNSTVTRGTTGTKIGSYILTNTSNEDAKISTFAIAMNANASSFQNLRTMIGATQIGQTYSTLSPGRYTYSPNGNITIPAHMIIVIDFYADVLTNAAINTEPISATSWSSCAGLGATTGDAISCSDTPNGQVITIAP